MHLVAQHAAEDLVAQLRCVTSPSTAFTAFTALATASGFGCGSRSPPPGASYPKESLARGRSGARALTRSSSRVSARARWGAGASPLPLAGGRSGAWARGCFAAADRGCAGSRTGARAF